jgi:hypothetical protein
LSRKIIFEWWIDLLLTLKPDMSRQGKVHLLQSFIMYWGEGSKLNLYIILVSMLKVCEQYYSTLTLNLNRHLYMSAKEAKTFTGKVLLLVIIVDLEINIYFFAMNRVE